MIVIYVVLRTRAFVLRNDFVYVRIPSAYRALPRQNELFRFFDSSFLEAPQAVPFHATATHCHRGMDFDDASFLVLRSELLVCPKFQVTVSQRRSRNGRAS